MNHTKLASLTLQVFPRRARKIGFPLMMAGALTIAAQAQLSINVGDHFIAPAAGQSVDIMVDNFTDDPVLISGLEFALELPTGGPTIENVDLLTGTLFALNNDGQVNNEMLPYRWDPSVFTQPLPPPASGSTTVSLAANSSAKVATILFNAEGFDSGGTWSFNLNDTIYGSTRFLDMTGAVIGAVITDGTLSVVPEPSSSMAVAGLLLGAAAFARRWRAKAVK